MSSRRQGLSPRTAEWYRDYLNLARDVVGIGVTGQEISQFLNALTCSAGGKHAYYRTLKTFYNWLYSARSGYGLIPHDNPMDGVDPPKVPKRILPSLTRDQVDLLIDEASCVRDKAIISLFADSGLRLSELANINPKDIDWENRLIKVVCKGNKEGLAPFVERTKKYLKEWLQRYQANGHLWDIRPWGDHPHAPGVEGEDGASMQSLTTNRFAVAGLYGKLANISPDLPSKALREAGPLKTLTGLDTVEAEKKFKDSFNFVNHAKMIFAANIPPEINEDTFAIWRRIIMVDFPNTFSGDNADKNLLKRLTTEQELSGLLNKALEGLQRLEKKGDFTYSRTIEETRSKYLMASNPALVFIDDCCLFDAWAITLKEDLYQAFMRFCSEHKIAGIPKKAFGHKIKRAYNLMEGNNEWRGIKLKE